MPLIRSKSALVIESINKENPQLPIPLSVNNCYLYGYQYVDHVKARCLVKGRYGSGFTGKTWVTYNKLDVATLTLNCARDVADTKGKTTLAYLPAINERYGFDLKPVEIQDLPVVNSVCKLVVQPESTIFCGSVDLKIVAPRPDIGQIISTREYATNFADYAMGELIPAFLLTASHDYSLIGESLYTHPTGVLDATAATALSTELKTVDTVPWGIVADTLYSLVGADVAYNGLISEYPEDKLKADVMRERFEYVMVINPVHTTTGLTDQPLVIHYNLYQNERS